MLFISLIDIVKEIKTYFYISSNKFDPHKLIGFHKSNVIFVHLNNLSDSPMTV